MRVRNALLMAAVAGLVLTGCSSSGGNKSVSVFRVKPGQCFTTPSTVKVQLSKLNMVPCTKAHTQEAYALVDYSAPGAGPSVSPTSVALTSSYPGDDVLSNFAQGACAQRFTNYVGVDYLDSKLFFTYLLPSARSWQQSVDRKIICFVTTTGSVLTSSVKGSKR